MFVAQPLLVNLVSGADESRSRPVSEVLPSIVAGGTHASLLVPVEGREGKVAAPAYDPMRTQSTRAETGLLVPLRNHGVAKPVSDPIDTVSAEGNHHALLMRNNEGGAEMSTPVVEPMRTLTTGGHQSIVEPNIPISLDVDDAGFRMLEPHEIQAGMGFARDYLLLGSKRDKVKQAGNAVTPPAARDLGHSVAEFLLGVMAS
jgi:DNA (cytosine-5)-methyltransferase 1